MILEEASMKAAKKMKVDGDLRLPALVAPRELSEEEALGNWCENIDISCTAEDDTPNSRSRGIKQAEELLGESYTSSSSSTLPSPHPSSSMEQEPPPTTPFKEESLSKDDCRVPASSSCCVTPATFIQVTPAA